MSLENGFYANTEKLHALQAEAVQDSRVADRLLEELKKACSLAEALGDRRLADVLQDMEKIARYCDGKQRFLDELCAEVELLSLHIGAEIDRSSEAARIFSAVSISYQTVYPEAAAFEGRLIVLHNVGIVSTSSFFGELVFSFTETRMRSHSFHEKEELT